MKNKFRAVYPQLGEPQIGDTVKMLNCDPNIYNQNDIGIIIDIQVEHGLKLFLVEINNNGDWWVIKQEFTVITASPIDTECEIT